MYILYIYIHTHTHTHTHIYIDINIFNLEPTIVGSNLIYKYKDEFHSSLP